MLVTKLDDRKFIFLLHELVIVRQVVASIIYEEQRINICVNN